MKEEGGLQDKQLLTQQELKEYLGITDEELAMIMPRGDESGTTSIIPNIKIGNRYYFPRSAIDNWLLEMETLSISR